MSTPSYRSYSSPEDSRSAPRRSDEPLSRERLIPFPAGSPNGSDARTRQVQRRRPESRDVERSSTARRPRRRRHSTPWLQRNALSLAALSFLFALLGLGFGLVQTLNRPEQTAALLAIGTPTEQQSPMMVAASVAAPLALSMSTALPAAREVQASAHVIDANYTVKEGDTLGRIAAQYNTSVERIAAFNNIADARALRIGARLVIPPPL